jgi:hypothetical protein
MPDAVDPSFDPAAVFAAGSNELDGWLRSLPGAPVAALGAAELDAYKARGFLRGWRLAITFPDAVRRIDILLTPAFPWKPPRFALVDRPPFLTWPHVEKDGLLCLASDGMEIDATKPVPVTQRLLGEASRMVERFLAGEGIEDDFRAEFLSYWDHDANHTGVPIVSLLDATPETRVVRLWRGKALYVVADESETIRTWLENRYGSVSSDFATRDAPFIWLGPAMVPSHYPRSTADLRNLLDAASWQLIGQAAAEEPDKIVTILGMATANGPALASVLVNPAPAPAHGARQPLTRGFRPGMTPQNILSARYLGGAKLTRATVTRADAAWIHGRGADPRARTLRGKTVVLVGCGSVGAALALALAQAGVGRLVLIDPDTLKWANIGRHPLGAADVDRPKAKAMAERIRRGLPHVSVDHHVTDLAAVLREHPKVLEEADLILAATGSWAAESELDTWHGGATGRRVPIVYGWTEAHACAGHAVLVGGDADLRTGFDATGLPRLAVTKWPDGSERQEPACGAIYQPYGPIELAFISAMIAELALDALLGIRTLSTQRIWTTSTERLRGLGGQWSPEWLRINSDEGSRIVERPWPGAGEAALQVAAE